MISEVYIEMNQEGPIHRKTLGYYAVTICMLASSHNNFCYAGRWADTFIYYTVLFFTCMQTNTLLKSGVLELVKLCINIKTSGQSKPVILITRYFIDDYDLIHS